MKKLLLVLFSTTFMLVNTAFAYDSAKLTMKISGNVNGSYYLCVNNSGCMKIVTGIKFPINAGKIDHLILANIKNMRMYPVSLPSSCQVNLNNGNTLTVSGNITAKNDLKIGNLRCSVS